MKNGDAFYSIKHNSHYVQYNTNLSVRKFSSYKGKVQVIISYLLLQKENSENKLIFKSYLISYFYRKKTMKINYEELIKYCRQTEKEIDEPFLTS